MLGRYISREMLNWIKKTQRVGGSRCCLVVGSCRQSDGFHRSHGVLNMSIHNAR